MIFFFLILTKNSFKIYDESQFPWTDGNCSIETAINYSPINIEELLL